MEASLRLTEKEKEQLLAEKKVRKSLLGARCPPGGHCPTVTRQSTDGDTLGLSLLLMLLLSPRT